MVRLSLLLLLFSTPVAADTNYIFKEPSCPTAVCGSAWTIYIDGEIRTNEGEILEYEILSRDISEYSGVYLNSPGGSLYGGIQLGRVIRKYGLNTNVGQAQFDDQSSGSQLDGICFSACTFAYLGGKFRYFNDSSVFGVHRFYSPELLPDAEASAQIASADIISYLQEIGIEPSFFVEMTKASSDSLRALPKTQLIEMGVVNNGVGPTSWTIQATPSSNGPSVLYAKGERETSYGINKALFFCGPDGRDLSMHIIFDPQGRAQQALAMGAFSLMLDGDQYRFTNNLRGDVEVVNGWINARFSLSEEHWSAINESETIGVAFQFSFDAPVFLGFSGMPLNGARNFLAGIKSACPAAYTKPLIEPVVDQTLGLFQRLRGRDFFGDDLTSRGIRDVSLNECEEICSNAQQCLAYSYVERLSWCFPKTGVGSPVTASGVISGIKQ